MNIVGCLDVPTSGPLPLSGRDVSDSPTTSWPTCEISKLASSPELPAPAPRHRAARTSSCRSFYRGRVAQGAREQAAHALDTVQLSDRMTHRPAELSGGQRQRVAIAARLVTPAFAAARGRDLA